MSPWRYELAPRAARDLRAWPRDVQRRIVTAVDRLMAILDDPQASTPGSVRAMQGERPALGACAWETTGSCSSGMKLFGSSR